MSLTIEKVLEGIDQLRKAQLKTDEQLAKTDAQLAKTDEQQIKTEKSIEKMSRRIDKMSQLINQHIGNDGQTVEEYFYRSLDKSKQLGDLKFDDVSKNVQLRKNDHEFDIVMFNGNAIALIEVKKKAHPKDLKDMVEKKVSAFKRIFPNYANYDFYFGVATMVSNHALEQEAKNIGVYLLTQAGGELVYLNDQGHCF